MERFALFSFDGLMLILRWLHLFFGVIWIGHLYYFNFVQGAFFAETDPSTKSNAIQKLVPLALWWFRWGAMYTFLTGLLYVGLKGHQGGFGIYETSWGLAILTGASLGTLMWANVWFIIWPNQKIVIASATQAAQGGKPLAHAAASANRASIASRTNTLFSIPMLFFMATASHLPLEISPERSLMPFVLTMTLLLGALEWNAMRGKMGPMASVRGVIHSGFALTLGIYVLLEILTK
jgi:uncharacterized membrane protein